MKRVFGCEVLRGGAVRTRQSLLLLWLLLRWLRALMRRGAQRSGGGERLGCR